MGAETMAEDNYHETISKVIKGEDEKVLEDLRHIQSLKNVNEYDMEHDRD